MHILSYQMTILLERNEQGYPEIYSELHIMLKRKRLKVQSYLLQMTEIPDRPFNKIAMDLIPECKTSTSAIRHILTISNHLTRQPEAFPYQTGLWIP